MGACSLVCCACGRLWRFVLSSGSVGGSGCLALSLWALSSGHCFFLVSFSGNQPLVARALRRGRTAEKGRRPENRSFKTGTPLYAWSTYVWYAMTVVLDVGCWVLWSYSLIRVPASSLHAFSLFTLLFVSSIYCLDRDQQDLGCKSRNFPAASTLGAFLLLRRSIGKDLLCRGSRDVAIITPVIRCGMGGLEIDEDSAVLLVGVTGNPRSARSW